MSRSRSTVQRGWGDFRMKCTSSTESHLVLAACRKPSAVKSVCFPSPLSLTSGLAGGCWPPGGRRGIIWAGPSILSISSFSGAPSSCTGMPYRHKLRQ